MRLLRKQNIGKMELKNSVYMAPMGTGTDVDGGFNQRNIDYLAARAKGGAALIITAANLATDKYESRAGNMLNSFQHVERVHVLAKEVHFHDSKLCVQISAGLGRVGAADPFTAPKSSSATKSFWYPDLTCVPLTKEEIRDLVVRIAYSAQLAKQGGADAVELHAYGGYLLDQFQTSIWNLRDDEYGGSLENRMRFTLEVIAEIKKNCGKDFPLIVKFTPEHGFEGGREIEEGIEMAKMMEAAGVDALHVDYGSYEAWYNAIPTVYQEDATQIRFAKQIKANVSIPVMSQGKLGQPEVAEQALVDECCDMVGQGHALLCEPDWVNKLAKGETYDMVPCIGCNECLYGCFQGTGLECAINPYTGYEKDYVLEPLTEKKRLLVIGGGPGGMRAAIDARSRGMDVELWEKSSVLGGTLIAAGAPGFKVDVKRYVEFLVGKTHRSGVNVRLGYEATMDRIRKEQFDAVIVATGSKPSVPPIPGVEQEHVKTSTDVLVNNGVGQKSVVIGGGLVGCETALSIQEDFGKEVVIIESLPDILMTVQHALNNDLKLRALMREKAIEVHCSATVKTIGKDYVEYIQDGIVHKIDCDSVVLATGYTPTRDLKDSLETLDVPVRYVGDCKEPRKIFDAVHEAFHAVRMLFTA